MSDFVCADDQGREAYQTQYQKTQQFRHAELALKQDMESTRLVESEKLALLRNQVAEAETSLRQLKVQQEEEAEELASTGAQLEALKEQCAQHTLVRFNTPCLGWGFGGCCCCCCFQASHIAVSEARRPRSAHTGKEYAVGW